MDWIGRIGIKVLARKIVSLIIQHFDLRDYEQHWIKEIEFEDLLEKDALLIYQHCGLHTLLSLLHNLPSLQIYVSEEFFFEAKRRYIRKYFLKGDPDRDAIALAVKLGVSDSFVHKALNTTGEKDERQQELL